MSIWSERIKQIQQEKKVDSIYEMATLLDTRPAAVGNILLKEKDPSLRIKLNILLHLGCESLPEAMREIFPTKHQG